MLDIKVKSLLINQKVLLLFVICIIFLIFFFAHFIFSGLEYDDSFLIINNENILFIDNDTYTYNDKISIECEKCYLDNKKIKEKIVLEDNGIYKLKINSKELNILLDNNLNFIIKDYFGNEIHNYESNVLAFKIESDNEIIVNNEKYSGQGFFKVGEYKLNDSTTININDIRRDNEYDIYIATSTLQILYASLIYSQRDNQSYMWVGRDDTINYEYLNSIDNLTLSTSDPDLDSLYGVVKDEIKQFIHDILQIDDNAYFNIYIDELRFYFEQDAIASLGLDNNRYSINYLTDGTLSYQIDNPYLEDDSYDTYLNDVQYWRSNLDKYRSGVNTRYLSDLAFLYVAIAEDNASYYLQYPDYFIAKDEKMSDIFEFVKYYDFNPAEMYNSLSKSEKNKFLNIIGFNKEEFDYNYFSDNSKPYLIITGEVPIDYYYGDETFKNMIKYIVDEYNDDYNILFKPHPRALPDEQYSLFFEELDIGVLPGKMPMEAITFVYNDLYLGGFTSSLYLSINSDNILFFFMNDETEVFEPIRSMLDEEFSNVKIIKPNDFRGGI
ncbi:MAG: hypothetical protein ACI4XM_08765 [Candidatus Coprovivens sp.]